ncbi:peptidase S66 [Paractinoplanes abujensis]|uniref:Muramoyltetrapeptide carboxypeptidase n=1 Tax=Paractinoplanes abujensis TaxID=882441 RepID=A0A7W7CQ61_9ACTN|nr:LD-carboxypeptidase [Actinoplanes abujensis]MBB4691250.1 muramoyltetrapeptide carboxypeptidase [Actinoplanes abujensis]GID17335.1 peptidase S66 [Actinoplanes abujensis]
MVRAGRLVEGDLVVLLSPSGASEPGRVAGTVAALEGWGLRVRLGEHAGGRHLFFAGTDDQRLADLNAALRDPEVRGVFCLRGGYGMQRIVDRVDFAAVRDDPKVVIGFSDITALHVALWREAGLVTVHGPTAGQFERGPGSLTVRAARRAVTTSEPVTVVADDGELTHGVRVEGVAEGKLLGGNLAMLATTVGTRHALDTDGAILLLEDVDEEPYRVDRMLVHLRRAGWLDGVRGIALGQFTNCVGGNPSYPPVADVLRDQLTALGVPVLGGLPIGHGDEQVAVGLGVSARLDTEAGTLVAGPAVT